MRLTPEPALCEEEDTSMTTTAWIVLFVLFVGLHLFMHRGHGTHRGAGASRARDHGGHGAHESAPNDAGSTAETEQHRHGGC